MLLSASVLSCDVLAMKDDIQRLESAGADALHFDIMDGSYVENFSFGFHTIEAVKKITRLPIEAHLEIINADKHIANCIKAGADTVIVHSDAIFNPIRVLSKIRSHGARAGYAINPGEMLGKALEILEHIDLLLIMSVEPGFGGQVFHQQSTAKAMQAARIKDRKFLLAMDGGISLENAEQLLSIGIDELIVGSALFSHGEIEKGIADFKSIAHDQPAIGDGNRISL